MKKVEGNASQTTCSTPTSTSPGVGKNASQTTFSAPPLHDPGLKRSLTSVLSPRAGPRATLCLSQGNSLSAARTRLCRLGRVFLQLSSTLFNPGWRREYRLGRVFLQMAQAQRMSSGTHFPSTLFNPGWCRGDAENVVWDSFSFNFPPPQVV